MGLPHSQREGGQKIQGERFETREGASCPKLEGHFTEQGVVKDTKRKHPPGDGIGNKDKKNPIRHPSAGKTGNQACYLISKRKTEEWDVGGFGGGRAEQFIWACRLENVECAHHRWIANETKDK